MADIKEAMTAQTPVMCIMINLLVTLRQNPGVFAVPLKGMCEVVSPLLAARGFNMVDGIAIDLIGCMLFVLEL